MASSSGRGMQRLGSDFVERTTSARSRRLKLSELSASPKPVAVRRGSLASLLSTMSYMSVETYARSRLRSLLLVSCTGLWVATASALLLVLDLVYRFDAVDSVRERYVAASAEDVGIQAAVVLSAAMAVHDAVDYAVRRKLYFEPLDYAAVRAALAPVLAAAPALRAVELAFSDRNESVRVLAPGARGAPLQVQSDAADCAGRLGARGCLAGARAHEQPWYRFGQQLAAEGEGSFRWTDAPGFVPAEAVEAAGRASGVAWAPAYSLVFRSVFPGTGGRLSLTGRATLDISSLRAGGRLGDAARLGAGGAAFVCDRGGVLLAAAEPGRVAAGRSPGRVRFRRIWELQSSWARHLTAEHFAAGTVREAAGFRVVVEPLRGRGLGHFSAVVAAPRGPFADTQLEDLCANAEVAMVLPYAVGLALLLALREYGACKRRRELRRVSPDPSPEDDEARPSWRGDPLAMLRQRSIRLPSFKGEKKRGFQTTLELKATGLT